MNLLIKPSLRLFLLLTVCSLFLLACRTINLETERPSSVQVQPTAIPVDPGNGATVTGVNETVTTPAQGTEEGMASETAPAAGTEEGTVSEIAPAVGTEGGTAPEVAPVEGTNLGTEGQSTNETPVDPNRQTHTVGYGETVAIIAKAYGVTAEAVAAINNLENINLIKVGQTLQIPTAEESAAFPAPDPSANVQENSAPVSAYDPTRYSVYIVRPGDTLSRIASSYGFTAYELALYNGFYDVNRIEVNQEIRIPLR